MAFDLGLRRRIDRLLDRLRLRGRASRSRELCYPSVAGVGAGHRKRIAVRCSNRINDNGEDHFCSNFSWSSLGKSCK